jgi:hypothetical protein
MPVSQHLVLIYPLDGGFAMKEPMTALWAAGFAASVVGTPAAKSAAEIAAAHSATPPMVLTQRDTPQPPKPQTEPEPEPKGRQNLGVSLRRKPPPNRRPLRHPYRHLHRPLRRPRPRCHGLQRQQSASFSQCCTPKRPRLRRAWIRLSGSLQPLSTVHTPLFPAGLRIHLTKVHSYRS